MPARGLNPGDMVVDLAALVQSVALATGAITATWLTWRIRRSWPLSSAAFVAGTAVGYIVAQVVGRILYRGIGRATTVIKVGGAALGSTVRAGLYGGFSTGVFVAILALAIFRPKDEQTYSLFFISLGCGGALGILFGYLAALL